VSVLITHVSSTTAAIVTMRNSLLYLTDIPRYFATGLPLSHLWTLATEEQFYLIWPLVLWVAYRVLRHPGRVALGTAVVFTVICIVTLALAANPADIYMYGTTWASAIALGGAAYFYRGTIRSFLGRAGGWAALAALIVLLALSFYPDAKDRISTYVFGPILIAVCGVLLINWATQSQHDTVRAPAVRPLRWLGIVSYAAYLWDEPVVTWWNRLHGMPAWSEVVTIPLTIAAAVVSWYTVEAVGRALRRRFDARTREREKRAAATP
jgi:peptidoglycan/LPS O-acetylase OafA/YrhL